MQTRATSLGASGLYELRPRHILLFLVVSGRGGGENSFDAYKARLKSESTKKKIGRISPDDIASILGYRLDDFSPLFCPLSSVQTLLDEERPALDKGEEKGKKRGRKGEAVCFTSCVFRMILLLRGIKGR